jgi:cytochrome c2
MDHAEWVVDFETELVVVNLTAVWTPRMHCRRWMPGVGVAVLITACAAGRRAASAASAASAAVARGRAAVARYGCDACHAVDRSPSTRIAAAAPIDGIARRSYIAGVVPNTQANLARWIQNPRQIKPRTGMPSLAVSAADAEDIAAYLRSRR